jgi:hypothetical protein
VLGGTSCHAKTSQLGDDGKTDRGIGMNNQQVQDLAAQAARIRQAIAKAKEANPTLDKPTQIAAYERTLSDIEKAIEAAR